VTDCDYCCYVSVYLNIIADVCIRLRVYYISYIVIGIPLFPVILTKCLCLWLFVSSDEYLMTRTSSYRTATTSPYSYTQETTESRDVRSEICVRAVPLSILSRLRIIVERILIIVHRRERD
jgi:hypothetical protein